MNAMCCHFNVFGVLCDLLLVLLSTWNSKLKHRTVGSRNRGAGLSGGADAGSRGVDGGTRGCMEGNPANTQYMNRYKSWYRHMCWSYMLVRIRAH